MEKRGDIFSSFLEDRKTVLGTAYLPLSTENKIPEQSKVEAFVLSASRAVPALRLSADDIDSVEYGILPMKGLDSNGLPTLYGSSKIYRKGPVVHVMSTKYTTFRSQALEILKLLY